MSAWNIVKFTRNMLESDERVDDDVCKLLWLPLLSGVGDDDI